ncbi:formyltetrahydrofolate deformylase [Halomonas urumqiensis]|uniref:Formyltetrahydrofolate deformylase n=1 Tax=Halomonas urumqiensis TaxID=1684789 RepID=A0A2N7UQS2_9GAMM|nr:formyltetrahydrofolate deformylase [Halomonas urumqiensis]PMR82770.1 formyltetrahydrofolate deformylase [Halomonas urumqiensis]PTB01911.1 formyltetrahydrofolate deformylase [Halomonas urumqiensis]GHE22018.1 formyltetrahydrofolate deformylase [Halomonas urumqiensis]
MDTSDNQYVLKVSCRTGTGIVAGITSYLSERGCNITELAQFDDNISGQFFMRCVLSMLDDSEHTLESLHAGFAHVAERFDLEWSAHDLQSPPRVLIMVSRFDHCLVDLLYRHYKGELNIEITAVVSNHPDLQQIVEREGISFIHLPVSADTKPEQEARLLDIIEETRSELVVLARYMQVLSDDLCRTLHGRAINIHHSFLPGFKGAKPYHQAFERGVKIIGATAHYVTADLDEGPIIEQSVQPVNHAYYPDELVALGRNTETMALARAVKLHTEHRIFLSGNKTIIFH